MNVSQLQGNTVGTGAIRGIALGMFVGLAAGVGGLSGCSEEVALEPAAVPTSTANEAQVEPARDQLTTYTGSQSHLGKARDAAGRIINRAEQQQQDLADQIDEWQRDPASNDPIPPLQPR